MRLRSAGVYSPEKQSFIKPCVGRPPARVGEKVAQLVGAAPGQVVVSDSTSVNLFKLVMAALALRPEYTRIVSDEINFPSDLYVLQGCVRLLGDRHHVQLVPSEDGISVDPQALYDAINEQTALVTLSPRSIQERLPVRRGGRY